MKIRFTNANLTWELNNQIIKVKDLKGQEYTVYKSTKNSEYKYKKQFENFFKFSENIEFCPCGVNEAFESLNLISIAKNFVK